METHILPWAAEALRAVLLPFILWTGGLLLALLFVLAVQRGIRAAAERLAAARRRQCSPLVDAWMAPEADAAALDRLVRACAGRRRHAAAALLLAPLASLRGELVDRARAALIRLGWRDRWLRDLAHRRWPRRARAASALGLIGEPAATARLIACLDDGHDEVRAAAVEALGRLGDPAAIRPLVDALVDSRHQPVRVVAALRAFGPAASSAILQRAAERSLDRRAMAEVLGQIGSAVALETLTAWAADADAEVRAAVWRAVGDVGLDDRTYYFALHALADADAQVRAMAARAIGRSGRSDAAPYLAPHLTDEWAVAAQSALALRHLGAAGRRQLAEIAGAGGGGSELARQAIWEPRP